MMEVEYTGPTIRVSLPDTMHPTDLEAIAQLLLSGQSASRMLAAAPNSARLRPAPRALPMAIVSQPTLQPAPITVEPETEPVSQPVSVLSRRSFTLSPQLARSIVTWSITGALFVFVGGGLAWLSNHLLLSLDFTQKAVDSSKPVEPAEPQSQASPPTVPAAKLPPLPVRVPVPEALPPISPSNPQAGKNPVWPLSPPPPPALR